MKLGGDHRPRSEPRPEPAPVGSRLAAVLAGSRVLVDVEIPRTGIKAKMRLLEHDEDELVTLELARWLAGLQVTESTLAFVGGLPVSSRRAVLTLSIAVRDPADVEKPLGTLEEWGRFDDSILGSLWRRYQDLVEEFDPMQGGEIDPATATAIRVAIEKKSPTSLLAFGTRTLVTYLLSSAEPPVGSETPRS